MRFHAGDALLQEGKTEEALAQFKEVLKRYPDGEWADECLLGSLRSHLAANRLDEAVAAQRALAARFPDSVAAVAAQGQLGGHYVRIGQYEDAVKLLESINERDIDAPIFG